MRSDYVQSVVNLASLYLSSGRHLEAEPMARQALHLHQEKLGKLHPRLALDLDLLARILIQEERWEEADSLYRRALKIQENALPADHPHRKEVTNNYIQLLTKTGRQADAEKLKAELQAVNHQLKKE